MVSPRSGTETRLRTVRSFVTRAGRLTGAQERALAELWPRFGVDFGAGRLDLAVLFGNDRPCTMEIGFGNGEHLAARAQAEPARNFLGVEVYRPGIGGLLRVAGTADLSNLRVIAHDAVEVLREQIAPDALDEVEILFPDPWPKKRHHKRRLIQGEFVLLVASRLAGGGRLKAGDRLGTLRGADARGARCLSPAGERRRGRPGEPRAHPLRAARHGAGPDGT